MAATIIAAAIRKAQRGCHAAAYSSSLSCVWIYVFTEVLLKLLSVLRMSILCKRAYRVLLRSLRPSLEESSRSRCSPPAPPLARDAIACSALEERAVYFISLSRRTLSTVLSSSSGERKWHPYAENVRPARVRQQLCPGVG